MPAWRLKRSRQRTTSQLARAAARFRPRVEELEARLAPSVNMLTYHNGNANLGKSQSETILTPANVSAATFGKLFTTSLDGQVYAQPLYKTGVTITTGPFAGIHNVVYVATEHDSVYAIDGASGQVLWHDSFINPSAGVTSVPNSDVGSTIPPEIGITGTPVIDPSTNTLYVMAYTKEVVASANHYVYRFHALDIGSGNEKFGGPLLVADTIFGGTHFTLVSGPSVNGTGVGGSGGKVTFNAVRQLQRPGLTLLNGQIYVAFGSHSDQLPSHGWLLSFSAASGHLQLVAVLNTTPNGSLGSIWQSGGKVAADTDGFLYFETGNGTFDTTLNSSGFPKRGDYGDSFVKVAVDPNSSPTHQNVNGWGLKVVDYFTPSNEQVLGADDLDLGSGAPVVLPGSVGSSSHPSLLIGGGKQGTLYLIDRNNMGKFNPNSDHVVQEVQGLYNSGVWGPPVYVNGNLYIAGSNSTNNTAKMFTLSNARLSSATSQSPDVFGYQGSVLTLSVNVTSNPILWAMDRISGQMRAYDGTNLARELYTTAQAANNRDKLAVIKFASPTVANGFVYAGSVDALVAYGLLSAKSRAAASLTKPGALAGVWLVPGKTNDVPQFTTGSASSAGGPAETSLQAISDFEQQSGTQAVADTSRHVIPRLLPQPASMRKHGILWDDLV